MDLVAVLDERRASRDGLSDALEKVFDRYTAQIRTISGVYGAAYEGDEGYAKIQADVAAFA